MAGVKRLANLLELSRRMGVDGVMILPGANMRYLLDFTIEVFERPAFLLAGFGLKPTLVVPRLDENRAVEAVGEFCEVVSYGDETGPWNLTEQLVSGLSGVLGIEGKTPYSFFKTVEGKAPSLQFTQIDSILWMMRVCKDSEEIDRHREASRILQEAMLRTLTELQPGMTERQVMFSFYKNSYEMGAETPYCLVQSGPNAANPHLEPTLKTIHQNEAIVFDAALTHRGYYADITRTIVLGQPSETQQRLFNIVKQAQLDAIHTAGENVPAEALDRAARRRISEEGLGEYFIHRTGHGLGVEVHEEPYIREGNQTPLKPGMIFTVEPGIYLPGRLGIRLEDNIIVVESSVVNTTKLPKTLSLRETLV